MDELFILLVYLMVISGALLLCTGIVEIAIKLKEMIHGS